MWSGTAASWVDLHPAGAAASEAHGTRDGRQVGKAVVGGVHRAGLWTGSAASWVDLHPTGFTVSQAFCIDGDQQGGYIGMGVGAGPYACIWRGSAESVVNLNPVGAEASRCLGIHAGRQVGYARIGGVDHASLWSGTAESWEDLSRFLVGSWGDSTAEGIWSDATTIYVVGSGYDRSAGTRALLWTRPINPTCYANCDASTVPPVLNVADFTCFQTKFAAGDPYANCDGSTVQPVLNIADFICFQTGFAAGCS